MNKVINACLNEYENKCEVSDRLTDATKKKVEFENWLRSQLSEDIASSVLSKLYELDANVESIMAEEYFEAGFNYGRSL